MARYRGSLNYIHTFWHIPNQLNHNHTTRHRVYQGAEVCRKFVVIKFLEGISSCYGKNIN